MMGTVADNVIEMRGVCTAFGSHGVHADLDLDVRRGEILAIVGGSGSGKSTLLREMIMLHRPNAGSIKLFGTDILNLPPQDALALRLRWGVMFQHGGLFGALTILQNIGLPLREHTKLDGRVIDRLSAAKLALSGLEVQAANQYPSQLSGGMMKRASLARALALDPELLFLDEPTAGLDPAGAGGIDALVRNLHALYRPTIVMITHDLDLLWQVTDRVAVLGDGKVLASGTMSALSTMTHPIIRAFFDGQRGRAAQEQHQRYQPQQPQQPQPQHSSDQTGANAWKPK
jgi:phospholipid/cholesterol/gamma-HCH transport system ATP-binding protein